MAGNLDIPQGGQPRRTQDRPIREAIETLNGLLGPENKIALAGLEDEARPAEATWYTPKIIAGEGSRTNTAFGALDDAVDQIKDVVVPEGGKIRITYAAAVKCSVAEAGYVGIFLNSTPIVSRAGNSELHLVGGASTSFRHVATDGANALLAIGATASSFPTTGVGISSISCFAAAGTYSVSVKFRATSGSITANDRRLWVEVDGPR